MSYRRAKAGQMLRSKYLERALLGTSALVFAAARVATPAAKTRGPVLGKAVELMTGDSANAMRASSALAASTDAALDALASKVRPLSHPEALADAFRSYFAYQSEHPEQARKPYLYFVDYGLPSTEPRGYVFDMRRLAVLDGPFTVAQGRGSTTSRDRAPTRFSNDFGSAATSLGLYVAQELYAFHGHAGGQPYTSVGLRVAGVSSGFNDNARARRVVVHGAPYVTPRGAGLSEGCPAMEPSRARRLLPKLAGGGLVFLFAPDARWLGGDPWLAAGSA
jgi:hypothetical protein